MKKIKCDQETPKIAYISDLHGFNNVNEIISQIKKEENIDLIVLGGDFTDYTIPGTLKVVNAFLKLNLNIILIPGSHENIEVYNKIFEKIDNKKLIDGYKNKYIKFGEYELIIINGSSSVVAGIPNYRGGSFWLIKRGKNKNKAQREANIKLKEKRISKKASLVFMEDIFNLTEKNKGNVKPSNKIILCHNPPKCKTKKGIDLAKFGVTTKDFEIKKEHLNETEMQRVNVNDVFDKGSVITLEEAKILKKFKYPIKIMKKNVGSKEITTLMNKYRINKVLCGHIHEAGPKAIDKKENKIKQNVWVNDVRINSGEGSKGKFTIIELNHKGKVKYKFVKSTPIN